MGSSYYDNLIKSIIDNSKSEDWDEAVKEWEIFDWEEDYNAESSCVCGKENIRYLFTIRNIVNENKLYPIGSSCIKKFNRTDLNELTKVKEDMFRLLHAIEKNTYISLSSEFFSRKLLKALYEEGAFEANEYNRFNSEDDYKFMLKMFNKRDKDSISEPQRRKIGAIIVSSIRPYLNEVLENKRK